MEHQGTGKPQNQPERIGRREFLRRAGLTAGGLTAAAVLAACKVDAGYTRRPAESLTPESQQQLVDKVWGGLTDVLSEDRILKDSLRVSEVKVGEWDTVIRGTLRGNSRQIGMNFSLNFSKEPDAAGEVAQLTTENASGKPTPLIMLGEQRKQEIELQYFIGNNTGDVRAETGSPQHLARNTAQMQQRFEDVVGMLKEQLDIPSATPFIPNEDFNGLLTFASNRTGYGQLIASEEGIDGKTVKVKVRDGLITDKGVWSDVKLSGPRGGITHYEVDPKKISFEEILRISVDRMNDGRQVEFWKNQHKLGQAPARDYITDLGNRFLPNQTLAAK